MFKNKAALLMSALTISGVASANIASAQSGAQKWSAGWDGFNERLNYKKSGVTWNHPVGKPQLSITYNLRGATPNRQYQVGIHVFNRCDQTFGRFPVLGRCNFIKRQGVTRQVEAVELGAVTTDAAGNGSFSVLVTDMEAGTYELKFHVRGNVGCLFGGSGHRTNRCDVVFQSPGPFGSAIETMTLP